MTVITPPHAWRIAAGLLATVAVAACGGGTRGAAVHASPLPTGGQGDSAAIAKARADSARYPYTPADIHFMSAMIHHHAQAIVMARWAPTHGASPSVQTLAERIINAQQDEIAIAQRWLRDRRQPVPDVRPRGIPMNPSADSGHAHGGHDMHEMQEMSMPGMLTAEQLKQLDQARGPEFDRLFLRFMIQHHRGAVTMVNELFATDGAAQDETVFKFASDVNVDQTTEIDRMQKMLVALLFERRAP